MKPFVIISDLHCHEWSAFGVPTTAGYNSRLLIIMNEINRARDLLTRQGGNTMYVAGDVFHVRGSVSPTVLNAVLDLFRSIVKQGIAVYILAGNHDLEGKTATRLGSAVTALEGVGCACISDGPFVQAIDRVGMIPWEPDMEKLKMKMVDMQGECHHLIIHAPLNNVIKGIPDAGLDPAWINSLGFRSVFAGHYHNHKDFPGSVYSIGAIAHHSWNDVGSQAGFLLVSPRVTDYPSVSFYASHAPRFVELDSSMSEVDMALEADGNYVKARLQTSDLKELTAIRKLLTDAGAKGVVLVPEPVVKTAARASTTVNKSMTIDESVASYVDAGTFTDKDALKAVCSDILMKTRSV